MYETLTTKHPSGESRNYLRKVNDLQKVTAVKLSGGQHPQLSAGNFTCYAVKQTLLIKTSVNCRKTGT